MPTEYLKKASKTSVADANDVSELVENILEEIRSGGESVVEKYAKQFDKYDGNIFLTEDEIEKAAEAIPENLKDDIRFARDNVRKFAEAQKSTISDTEIEIVPGLIAGQKSIPCQSVGCYVPGGRYSHIASAIMTVTTAKVAGCEHIAVCSPPRPNIGINPAIIYTSRICGADKIQPSPVGYSCWSRKSVCGGSQAHFVWSSGH